MLTGGFCFQFKLYVYMELMEDTLALRDEPYRTLIQTAMDGFWLVDLQGNLLDVNETYCQMSGYSEQELLTMSIYNLESSETAKETSAHIQQIILKGQDRFTSQHCRKDGSLFYVEVSTQYCPDDGGLFVCFLRDITERKQTEEQLTQERALLRCVIDSAEDLIYFKDHNSAYIGCNKASEKFTGIPESEQIGKTDFDFFDREQAEQIIKDDQKVIESGTAFRTEEWVSSPLLGRLLLDTLKTPIYGPGGQPLGLVGISRDITERKKAEKALQKSERLFRVFFESNPVATIITSPSGAIHMINPAFLKGSGYSVEEVVGQTTQELGFWRDPATRELMVAAIKEHGFIDNLETILYRKGGLPMTGLVCSRAIEYEDEVRILSTVVDVTAQRAAEKALRKLDQDKSNFIASAAHELRTPLVAILGYAELLESTVQPRISAQQQRSYSSIIISNAEILTRLTDDLLDVEQIQLDRPFRLTREKTSLAELIKEALISFTLKYPDHSFILTHTDTLPEIMWIDSVRTTQTLNNLLDNAVKYSPESRIVEVTTETEEKQIKISIKDQGVGMTSEEIEQIFHRFYRAKPMNAETQGLGLGMYIVKRIIEEHGGEIYVASRLGEGTTVTFTLPIKKTVDMETKE